MMSFTGFALYLTVLALFLYGLYVVVNKAVLHALRTHADEQRAALRPGDRT
jgi:hypothetical protein